MNEPGALSSYPNTSRAELATSASVTTLKLVLSYVSQALVVAGLVAGLARLIRTRQHDRDQPTGVDRAASEMGPS